MLHHLHLQGVGPAAEMKLDLKPRFNIITGDNGLGKSFLLDVAWWALTRKWPKVLNPQLTSGYTALPREAKKASLKFSLSGKGKKLLEYSSTYAPRDQAWTGKSGRPANPGLVLYAMADGSFALWDPARNYWKTLNGVDEQDRPPAYIFSPSQVWDGLPGEANSMLCNGLIRDWAGWQKENGEAFKLLKKVLEALSPSEGEKLCPGKLTRISLDDVRDMPTIRMPYEADGAAIVHASSGIRRIVALAYFLVWSWEEHKRASSLVGDPVAKQIIFLVDEIESHLHPSWQRSIMPALLGVAEKLHKGTQVQILATTHSPLIMASLEPAFTDEQDAWFDLDSEHGKVALRQREFVRKGDASKWLISPAFDLQSSYSLEAERMLQQAQELLSQAKIDKKKALELDAKLRAVLSDTDSFSIRWRFVGEKQGWLK